MKKKDFILLLGFASLFILFALFQNFSFITENAPDSFSKIRKIQFFKPYFIMDRIGNLEAPLGFKDAIRTAAGPTVFDHKKYLNEKLHEMPIYNSLKSVLDFNSNSGTANAQPPCIKNPSAAENNCYVEYNDNPSENTPSGMRFKTNPFRGIASVSYNGDVNSEITFDQNEKSVNVEIKKQLNPNSNLKFEVKSQDQSGSVNIDLHW